MIVVPMLPNYSRALRLTQSDDDQERLRTCVTTECVVRWHGGTVEEVGLG